MSPSSALAILVATVFANNILLSYFLGVCSFVSCSRQMGTAFGLGAAVTFVMTATTLLNHLIYHGVLAPGAPLCGLDLTYLTFIVFIAVIAAFVQLVEMFMERFTPRLEAALGIFLPLITVNCAIFGVALFMVIRDYTLWQSLFFGLGGGLGWWLAIVLLAGMRQKMAYSDVPEPFRGAAITLIVTGVMALAFMGFTGMTTGS